MAAIYKNAVQKKSMQILMRMTELKPHQMNLRRKNSDSILIGSDLYGLSMELYGYLDVVSHESE